MSDVFFVLIIFSIVVAGVIAAVFYMKREAGRLRQGGPNDGSLGLIKQDLEVIRAEIKKSRESNVDFLQNQMRQSGKLIKDITSQLEGVKSGQQDILALKGDLGKLNDVLANPKQRGILGEYFLETLLKNIFPPGQYEMQHRFANGETVDAVVFVKDKMIPIDAKFSLENYNRILEEKNPAERERLEKDFKADLKTRIEETSKYIRPAEGTMDFAFMFVPSEGIYYDLLINQVGGVKVNTSDLIEFAFREKHVMIVSPTSFYAYLQTVMQGLRALQIEESAKEIKKNVEALGKHYAAFDSYMQKLGNNLSTVVNCYNTAHKELGKIDKDVVKITEGERSVEPLQIDKPNILE
ncbi:MAG: DNA recombination protein RmuC [Candidatus Pacebacteria bacterium]|nr:DNA recombination protein RmuC [Candidatus Paceibacterota bacterium]